MEEAQLHTAVPAPLKRRLDWSPRITFGMKRRIVTVALHEILDRIEGDDGAELGRILEREVELNRVIASDESYAKFRSKRDGPAGESNS